MANGHGGRRAGSGKPRGYKAPKTLALEAAAKLSQTLTAEATLEAIRRGMSYDIRSLVDAKGNTRPLHQLSAEEAFCISGLKVLKRNLVAGDGHLDTILEYKIIDRSRYVEMAAKYHKLLTDVLELPGLDKLGEKIARARQRAAKG